MLTPLPVCFLSSMGIEQNKALGKGMDSFGDLTDKVLRSLNTCHISALLGCGLFYLGFTSYEVDLFFF